MFQALKMIAMAIGGLIMAFFAFCFAAVIIAFGFGVIMGFVIILVKLLNGMPI